MSNTELKVGYSRQCVTPALGTYLGGYGNGKDRQTVGKIFEDDDLWVTLIAITDANGESVILGTVDVVRIPVQGYIDLSAAITKVTGVPDDHIIIGATHSHSSPDFIDGAEYIQTWKNLLLEQTEKAAVAAMADRKPAEIYGGIKRVKDLNWVRRYMLNGEFLGTNCKGDAHETQADNRLQVLKFVREGGEDIVLCNWGAHADHSKCFGGPEGSPTFHKGCSADYNYALRKTVEENTGAKFAFFQAAAGNLNPTSTIPEERYRFTERMEREQVIRPVAYGRELADEVLSVLNAPMQKLSGGTVAGAYREIQAERAKGPAIGSPEYNRAKALCAVTYVRPLEEVTKESLEGATFVQETWELGTDADVERIAADMNDPMHDYAIIVKMLRGGEKLECTTAATRAVSGKLCKFFGFNSGPYSASGLVRHTENMDKPPITLPLHALCFGDVAFAGAPGEVFDQCGADVKDASPFGMTFYLEICGGAYGYFPTRLACSHGGYEVGSTGACEGTVEAIAEAHIRMLKELKEK